MGKADTLSCVIYPILLACARLCVENEHLWRHCMHGSSWNRRISVCNLLSQAEIDQCDLHLLIKENMRSLQVFVHYALLVQSIESDDELNSNMAHKIHQVLRMSVNVIAPVVLEFGVK